MKEASFGGARSGVDTKSFLDRHHARESSQFPGGGDFFRRDVKANEFGGLRDSMESSADLAFLRS